MKFRSPEGDNPTSGTGAPIPGGTSGAAAPAAGEANATAAPEADSDGGTVLTGDFGGGDAEGAADYEAALAAVEADWKSAGAGLTDASVPPPPPGPADVQGGDLRTEVAALKAEVAALRGTGPASRRPDARHEPLQLPNPADDPSGFAVALQGLIDQTARAAIENAITPVREEVRRGQTESFAALGDYAVGQAVHAALGRHEYASPVEVNAAVGDFCRRQQRLPTVPEVDAMAKSSHDRVARVIHDRTGAFIKALREKARPASRPAAAGARKLPAPKIDAARTATPEGRAQVAREVYNQFKRARRAGGDEDF